MDSPLVSIVTVTRNRGNLLRRCIASVLNQTYHNIEHIVVDGASDDNTDEVVAGFNDARLRFVKLDYNWPLHETMVHAVDLCKGKYLSFLDSDDEYVPTKIEKQVALIESLPEDYGFVYCWMSYFDTSNNNRFLFSHRPTLRGGVGDEVVKEPIISGTPTLMFKLDFFKSIGGWKTKEEIGKASDWEMCCRACQLCKVDFVPESLVNVYINHGSVRQSDFNKYYMDPIEREIKFQNYFLEQFKDIFKRHPDYAVYHYATLSRRHRMLGHHKETMVFTKKYLGSHPRFIDALKHFYYLLLRK